MAVRLATADAETLLQRFTRGSSFHARRYVDMGRRAVGLVLSDANQTELQAFVRPGAKATRARIFLMSAQPQPTVVLATTLGVCTAMVQIVGTLLA